MRVVLSAYQSFLDVLERATYFVTILLMGLLLFNTSLGMAFDTFGGYSLPWTEEVNTLLFAWCCLLGAGAIARVGGHIGVDTLLERLSPPIRYGLRVLHTLLALLLVWVMVFYGIKLAEFVGMSQKSLYLDINLIYYYMCVPVGGVILGLNCIGAVLPDPREASPR